MGPRCLRDIYLLMLCVSMLAAGCEKPGIKEEPEAKPRIARVSTLSLKPMPWVESIHTHGVMEAAEEVTITVDFSAAVRSVLFREGDRVRTGESIIELDPLKRELRLSQATTAVNEAKARLEQAAGMLERREGLHQRNVIPREQYDEALTDWRSAGARYNEALAAQQLARRELSETTVISPVSGRVARRLVDPGETVMPGQKLAVVQAVDSVRVVTYVSEKDVNALRVGAEARVSTPGVRGREYPARVESVGVKADPRTGNFPVKLAVQHDDGLLRDGMTASVELRGIVVPEAILVPEAAIVDRNRRRVVYKIVEGEAVEVRPVFVASTGERVPVLDGLEAGDVLIVGGLESVLDGSVVEPLPPGESP